MLKERKWVVMDRRGGFTLIELLVVIAIIALLMSILMPALARVRKQAKAVICQSNLKQWGSAFAMYFGDNDGKMFHNWAPGDRNNNWLNALRKYCEPKGGVACCPEATRPLSEGRVNYGTFSAWGIMQSTNQWFEKGDYGSYGINAWVHDRVSPVSVAGDEFNFWRSGNVRNAGYVPLFLDALFIDSWPRHTDEPPVYEGEDYLTAGGLRRFCINRHSGFINILFLDMSVRPAGLKELWILKWHRNYDTHADPPVWPDWMKEFRDYVEMPAVP